MKYTPHYNHENGCPETFKDYWGRKTLLYLTTKIGTKQSKYECGSPTWKLLHPLQIIKYVKEGKKGRQFKQLKRSDYSPMAGCAMSGKYGVSCHVEKMEDFDDHRERRLSTKFNLQLKGTDSRQRSHSDVKPAGGK